MCTVAVRGGGGDAQWGPSLRVNPDDTGNPDNRMHVAVGDDRTRQGGDSVGT